MKIRTRYLLAAALAAAPATLAAQTITPAPQPREHHGQHGEMHGRRGPGEPGHAFSPVQGILRRREQLGLTAQQVSRLEAIDRDLQARVEPLRQQLRALMPEHLREGAHRAGAPAGERRERAEGGQARGERRAHGDHPGLTAEQRQQMERVHQQAQPLFEQLHQHVQAALTQARAVLTPEQQRQVQAAMERHGRRDGHHGEHGPRGERPRQGGRQPR